jgi:hypothetical protein
LALQATGVLLAAALCRKEDVGRLWGWLAGRRQRVLVTLLILLGVLVLWQSRLLPGWWYPRIGPAGVRAMAAALLLAVVLTAVRTRMPASWHRRGAALLIPAFALHLILTPSPFMVDRLRGCGAFRKLYGAAVVSEVVHSAARQREAEARSAVGTLVEHTVPKGATVLVPPDWMDFRLLSLRSPYVTFKDGAPTAYDRQYAELWLRRIREVHGLSGGEDGWRRDPSLSLTLEEIKGLAASNRPIHLDYLVTKKSYALPLAGEAKGYRLYRIGGEVP